MPNLITRTIPMQPSSKKDEAPKTFPKGRVCRRAFCKTILSVYNKGPECHQCNPTGHRFVRSAEELRELLDQAA